MKRKIILIICILGLSIAGISQVPGNVKLYQIKTPHYRLIFTKEIAHRAQSLSKFLEATYPANTQTLGVHPRRLTIVLDNQSTISNGYCALGPRHSFWYMTPYPEIALGIGQWDELLGLHEMRHNIQFTALDKNFNKALEILDGQWGLAGGVGWSIPQWFMEGDAQFQETVLSNCGRGRVGRFAMPVKAIALDYPAKDLNYYKFFYRSYKQYYPNHYYLGYYMVTYVNRHWGPQIWSRILYNSTKWAFLPNAMNLSLRKYTSLTYRKLFDSTFAELKARWSQNIDTPRINETFTLAHNPRRTYTNYFNPFVFNDSTLITVKSGFDQLPTLILLDQNNGKEKKLKTIINQDFFYSHGLVAWAEIDPHPRWTEAAYSNIYIYDTERKKTRKITRKGRFFSPVISPDGKYIACVELDYKLIPHIAIIEIKTGKVTTNIAFDNFDFIRFPRFSADGSSILFAGSGRQGNGLFELNINSRKLRTIISPTSKFIIEKPITWKKYIIFTSDISRTENVFAIDTATKEIYQITHQPLGAIASDIDAKTGQLYIYNYTAQGFDPAVVYLHDFSDSKVKQFHQENYFVSAKTRAFIHDYTQKDYSDTTVKITRYPRAAHLINPHSWLWNIKTNTDSTYNASISLYSQDVLKELNLKLTSSYQNIGQITNSLALTYSHFYPIFEINLKQLRNWTDDRTHLYGAVNIALPYTFSRNIWYRKIQVKEKNALIINLSNNKSIAAMGLNFTAQNIQRMSYRDPESRFGQSIYADYTQILSSNNFQITGIGNFNFPGILRHDIIKLSVYKQHIIGRGALTRQIPLPAGYSNKNYSDIERIRFAYHVPLLYPDWGWRPVFNIKRIRARLFYDMAILDYTTKYSSTGLQILFDFNLFGFNIDLSAGIQFAYRLTDNRFVISPIIDYIPLNF